MVMPKKPANLVIKYPYMIRWSRNDLKLLARNALKRRMKRPAYLRWLIRTDTP
jgi:hypothetical protein